jgi:hypothetical protein
VPAKFIIGIGALAFAGAAGFAVVAFGGGLFLAGAVGLGAATTYDKAITGILNERSRITFLNTF